MKRLLMVAPNGARLSMREHPGVPLTPETIAQTARASREAGAGAIHLHVRDALGAHSLDAGLYAEATAEIKARAGADFVVQITTEAAGRYSPLEQVAAVRRARPEAVSVALREVALAHGFQGESRQFYAWCRGEGIAVQHIVYGAEEFAYLAQLVTERVIWPEGLSVLMVIGQRNKPATSSDFLASVLALHSQPALHGAQWMCCAFGREETRLLGAALALGGHVRVGFENSLVDRAGLIAPDNGARVQEIASLAQALGAPLAIGAPALAALGRLAAH